jgi:hypothetical protein
MEYDKYGYEYEPYKKITTKQINKHLQTDYSEELLKLIEKFKDDNKPKKTQEEIDMEILEKMNISHIEKFLRKKKLQKINRQP